MNITEIGYYKVNTAIRKGCKIQVMHLLDDKLAVLFIDYTGAWYVNEYFWFTNENFYRLFDVIEKIKGSYDMEERLFKHL